MSKQKIEIDYNYRGLEKSYNREDPIFIEKYVGLESDIISLTLEEAEFIVGELPYYINQIKEERIRNTKMILRVTFVSECETQGFFQIFDETQHYIDFYGEAGEKETNMYFKTGEFDESITNDTNHYLCACMFNLMAKGDYPDFSVGKIILERIE